MTSWQTIKLGDLVVKGGLVRGPFGGALKKETFKPSGYKVYEQRNAIYQTTKLGEYYIGDEKFQELKRFSVKEGDFIISCSGTIGRIFQIPKNAPEGVINQALLKVTVDRSKILPAYFYQYFNWDKFQSEVIDNTQGGAMQNLVGMDIFRSTKLHLPGVDEQARAVGVLQVWDEYIEKLEQKIALKEQLKKGLMQQYFSIAPSSEDVVELQDLVKSFSTGLNPRENFKLGSGSNRYVTIKNISNGRLDFKSAELIDDIALAMIAKRSKLAKNDVIMSSIGNIGESYLLTDDPAGWNINESVFCLKPNQRKVLPTYLYYLVTSEFAKRFFDNHMTGSSFKSIKMKDLKSMPVRSLSLHEQSEIVKVLRNIDEQLSNLNEQRDYSREQKKYLLKNLITGTIQMPENLQPMGLLKC